MKAEPNRRDQMTPHERRLAMEKGERTDRIPVIAFYRRDIRPPDRDIEPGVLARCRKMVERSIEALAGWTRRTQPRPEYVRDSGGSWRERCLPGGGNALL